LDHGFHSNGLSHEFSNLLNVVSVLYSIYSLSAHPHKHAVDFPAEKVDDELLPGPEAQEKAP
jgi:hypothetical protein